MINVTNRVRLASALALMIVACAVVAALALRPTEATSAPVQSPTAPSFTVLQPATDTARSTVPDEANERLEFALAHLGIRTPQTVTAVGVIDRSRGDITVAAVGNVICAFLARGVGTCDDRDRVEAGQSIGAEPIGCDAYRVVSVVPDGVARILVDSGGNGTIDMTIPVESNVYIGTLEPARTVATGIDATGTVKFTVDVPLDYYADTNGACK